MKRHTVQYFSFIKLTYYSTHHDIMIKLICDNCKEKIKTYTDKYGYTRSRKTIINGLMVCRNCGARYKRNGNFKYVRTPIKYQTEEEKRIRKEKIEIRWEEFKDYKRKQRIWLKKRSNYLKSISPEELIEIVRIKNELGIPYERHDKQSTTTT